MKLTVLGSSGGNPTRTNPASGYLIEVDDAAIWVDAGTGTFMALAGYVDPGTLAAVVISHVHVDHCSDLFGLYGYLAYGPSGIVPIPVFVPSGAAAHLAAFAGAGPDHLFHTVLDLIEVDGGDEADVGEVRLRFGDAVHSVRGLVTRIDAGGSSMAYSGDTGPGSDLVEAAADVDLLLCEASIPGMRHDQTYPYHLTAAEAGAIASAAGAGELVVTHLATGVDPVVAVAEAQGGFDGPVRAAMRGMSLTIGGQE
jgi:ribonuclease BN (tRNA processing enzyme)